MKATNVIIACKEEKCKGLLKKHKFWRGVKSNFFPYFDERVNSNPLTFYKV